MKTKKTRKLYEWQERAKKSDTGCEICGRMFYLTVDHIIPVSLLMNMNLMEECENWEDNFRIICGACNRTKGAFLDIRNPKTYRLLREAIDKSESQIKLLTP